MFSRQPYTVDRIFRILITLTLTLGVLWLIKILSGVLLPFFVACLIAYMFEPFVQFNRKLLHLKGRIVAIFVTLFETTFFFGLLCYFIIPMVLNEARDMGSMLKTYAATELQIPYIPAEVHDFVRQHLDFDQISEFLSTADWQNTIEKTLTTLWEIIAGSLSFVFGLFSWCIVLLYVIFIMIDYERLANMFRNMVPPRRRELFFGIGRDIKDSMNHYFRGQSLVAFIVGVLFSIAFSIVGLPMAIIMGMFIGLLNMVPYLQLVSFIPVTLLCLVYSVDHNVSFWSYFGIIFLIYCVIQAIQDLFLTPKIMGKAMGLNPAIILLSLSIWGTLLGFLGLIIALPLTTLLLSYYDRYVIKNFSARKDAKDIEQSPV